MKKALTLIILASIATGCSKEKKANIQPVVPATDQVLGEKEEKENSEDSTNNTEDAVDKNDLDGKSFESSEEGKTKASKNSGIFSREWYLTDRPVVERRLKNRVVQEAYNLTSQIKFEKVESKTGKKLINITMTNTCEYGSETLTAAVSSPVLLTANTVEILKSKLNIVSSIYFPNTRFCKASFNPSLFNYSIKDDVLTFEWVKDAKLSTSSTSSAPAAPVAAPVVEAPAAAPVAEAPVVEAPAAAPVAANAPLTKAQRRAAAKAQAEAAAKAQAEAAAKAQAEADAA